MSKKNFDEIVSNDLNDANKISQSEQALTAFKEFQDKVVPSEVDAYEWENNELLIDIFKFEPEDELSFQINADGDTSIMNKVRYFSLAKILAAGPNSKYKVGDIVKLKDRDVLTIESSRYKDWISNPMSKSNVKQKGEEPVRFMSNIFQTFGQYAFVLNPLDIEKLDGGEDSGLYKVTDSKIENRIKNVELLFNNF